MNTARQNCYVIGPHFHVPLAGGPHVSLCKICNIHWPSMLHW